MFSNNVKIVPKARWFWVSVLWLGVPPPSCEKGDVGNSSQEVCCVLSLLSFVLSLCCVISCLRYIMCYLCVVLCLCYLCVYPCVILVSSFCYPYCYSYPYPHPYPYPILSYLSVILVLSYCSVFFFLPCDTMVTAPAHHTTPQTATKELARAVQWQSSAALSAIIVLHVVSWVSCASPVYLVLYPVLLRGCHPGMLPSMHVPGLSFVC